MLRRMLIAFLAAAVISVGLPQPAEAGRSYWDCYPDLSAPFRTKPGTAYMYGGALSSAFGVVLWASSGKSGQNAKGSSRKKWWGIALTAAGAGLVGYGVREYRKGRGVC